jgi:hypothetical protein
MIALLEIQWPGQHKINRGLLVLAVDLVALARSTFNRVLLIFFCWSGYLSDIFLWVVTATSWGHADVAHPLARLTACHFFSPLILLPNAVNPVH